MQQASTLRVTSDPSDFTLFCTNYSHLPPYKQQQLRAQIQNYYYIIPEECHGMLKLCIKFGTPVHSGMFLRRMEILIFQLRCSIDPSLAFAQGFRYA
jgi:hypothetical protein